MSVLRGDCVEVMAGMEPDSVDAIVCDPPYGLEFMGKEWDRPWSVGFSEMGIPGKRMAMPSFGSSRNPMCRTCRKHQRGTKRCECAAPDFDETPATASAQFGEWCRPWATAALRVAKPGAYLLAFGGTRTVHRMTCALEDAGWVIRDMLVWAYAQGFPKSRASLKPAWEPIVLCRKPGLSRELGIDMGEPLTGAGIESLTDAELIRAVETRRIFARVSPEQKSRIIKALQRDGRAVGFLGDGVNDSIALHESDVGISVDSATDVAKDAADVVLLEKDLTVLANGIELGRRVFNNTIKYLLMGTSGDFGNMFSAAIASVRQRPTE